MTFWQMKEPLIPTAPKSDLLFFIHFLGCMLIMAACFTYAHCAYILLLSMLDCYRMHHAVTWWVIGTQ